HFPAPDPINALLSFGYTLLLTELAGAIRQVGLDPYLGALHSLDPARPSLALDLEEPFRPLAIDRPVFAAVVAGRFDTGHFVREGERALLTAAGRAIFFTLYEEAMQARVRHPLAPGRVSVRHALELHARLAARAFADRAQGWEGVTWP